MQFPGFYGNALLRQRLSSTIGKQKAGHCYILCGPAGSGKKTLARILAATLQCTGEGTVPCGVCNSCHKAFKDIHPDIITIDSDKATLPVDLIRSMRADAFTYPNEGRRKIYIIPRAQDMQDVAQNALLKILEEPPAYCTFILLTDSADKLLSTVRSRAVELLLSPLGDSDLVNALLQLRPDADRTAINYACEQSEGYLGTALELIDSGEVQRDQRLSDLITAYTRDDEMAVVELLVPMEKQNRATVLQFVSTLYQYTVKAMRLQMAESSFASDEVHQLSGLERVRLMTLSRDLQHIIMLLQANGNTGGCIGLLLTAMTS